jgi:hypothetical protein
LKARNQDYLPPVGTTSVQKTKLDKIDRQAAIMDRNLNQIIKKGQNNKNKNAESIIKDLKKYQLMIAERE